MTNPTPDLFDDAPSFERVEREALRMWREREMRLPAFVRRMRPDDLDIASGAWALMLGEARRSLSSEHAVHLRR